MLGLTNVEWLVLFTAFVSSFGVCALIVLTQRWHGTFSLDHDTSGEQKFHTVPVPRIGGVALLTGLGVAAAGLYAVDDQAESVLPLALLACGLPAFLAGLVEDFTKQVSVGIRLLATFTAAGLAAWLLGAQLSEVDTPLLDSLLMFSPLIAFAFTCFAVGGVANAVNIIDGFNGLAGSTCVLMFAGLGALAHGVGDTLVLQLCLMGMAAFLGFLCLNFPFGKLFLGDGGAYLAGFWVAECAVLLLSRNPTVSTWAVLLCCAYPVWETIFSMWRKSVVRKTGMGKPDKLHFHMLVYRRWTSRFMSSKAPAWQRHMMTTLAIAFMVTCVQVLAWWMASSNADHSTFALGIGFFALAYVATYRNLTIRILDANDETETPLPRTN
jgi:UDP-N-acetylmuramyl pentapeptide phosphotransferase/UDP-N-acetylglucosamine-1-phosphate transferase